MNTLCKHARSGFCKACWAAEKRRSNPAAYAQEKKQQRVAHVPRSERMLLRTALDMLEPWQVLLSRIIGQAADDYCTLTDNDEDWWSADAFFHETGLRDARIRKAARKYCMDCELEDYDTTRH